MSRCIWLDGCVEKACDVLKARLEPLGYRVVCKHELPDHIILAMAEALGCTVVTCDKRMELQARCNGFKTRVVYVDPTIVQSKSARDLATRIIVAVWRGWG